MSKIPVVISDSAANVSGGRADYKMLYPFVDDIVVVGQDVTAANVSGGVLSITQATATALGVGNPIPALSPAAYFKFNTGITVTGSGVSQWDDQSGNGRHLLQGTDAARPPKQANGTLLFNGTGHVMKTAAFSVNQPFNVFLVFKQISWAANDYFFDGNTAGSTYAAQKAAGASPEIILASPTATATNTDLAVGSYGVVNFAFNGASSSITVDANAATTGSAGTSALGALTLGANADQNFRFSNIQVAEAVVFTSILAGADLASVYSHLASVRDSL